MTKKVTKIVAQKRAGRYNIYLDEQYAFPISESVMIKFRVFKGMEVDEQLQAAMIAADDVSKAYTRALDYLSHQLRTEKKFMTSYGMKKLTSRLSTRRCNNYVSCGY